MATITGSTAHANWDFKLEVTEGTPSVAGNTSPLTVKAYIGRNGVASYMHGAKISITVKVTGCSNQTITYNNSDRVDVAVGQWVLLGSTTFSAVPHDSNGSKTVTVSASFTNNISPKSGSASGSVKLTDIPRKSSLTASNGTLGTAQTLGISRADSSFTHTITYTCGSASGTIATKTTGTSISWTPPLSLASQNTTGTTVSITLTVTTYSGSTSLGSNTKTITCSMPASVKPSCSITLEDTTGWDDTYGAPVQGLSKIKITVTPTQSYSSPIASYAVSADGKQYTAASVTTEVLKNAGSSKVTATVKDKRGRSGTAEQTMNVLAYSPPNVSKLSVHRCDEDGTENDQGEYIRIIFSAAVTALNNKNTATYTLRYKKSTATSFTTTVFTAIANRYEVTEAKHIIAADSNSSYDIEVEAKDSHGTGTRSTSASTAFTLINWHPDGTGLAFGKVAEKSGALEIALRMYDRFGQNIGNGLAAYGASGNAIDADTTLESHFLTTKGTPTTDFWHVLQLFYSSKTETSNRVQLAIPYNKTGALRKRYYVNGSGWSAWESEALQAYPVGSIHIRYDHIDPATLFGGKWERITERFLWATSPQGTVGATGGSRMEDFYLAASRYGGTTSGGDYPGRILVTPWDIVNNDEGALPAENFGVRTLPPYIQVSIWRRTA